MRIIRERLVDSIENSLAQIPEGEAAFADVSQEDMGMDQRVQYRHESEALALTLRVSVGASKVVNTLVDRVNVASEGDGYQIEFRRVRSTFDGSMHSKAPKQVEGSSFTFPLLQLGRVARTLKQAAKVINDPDSKQIRMGSPVFK